MKKLEKDKAKANLALIKKLISRVINYNLKYDMHIFIDYFPHCNGIEFRKSLAENMKWDLNCDMTSVTIYYDHEMKDVEDNIKLVDSWLTKFPLKQTNK